MGNEILDVTVVIKEVKGINHLTVKWTENNNSMQMSFDNQYNFLDFCDIFEKAKKLYLAHPHT